MPSRYVAVAFVSLPASGEQSAIMDRAYAADDATFGVRTAAATVEEEEEEEESLSSGINDVVINVVDVVVIDDY